MAFLHGRKSKFSVDNAAGSLVNLSDFIDDIQFSQSIETAEVTTMGQTSKQYITGMTGATISIKGNFDANGSSTVDPVLSGILGQDATVSFEYQPSNASPSSTNPKFTGEAILTSYEVSSAVGDAVKFSAEFTITGTITRATS